MNYLFNLQKQCTCALCTKSTQSRDRQQAFLEKKQYVCTPYIIYRAMRQAKKEIEKALQALYTCEEIKSIGMQLLESVRHKTKLELLTEWDYTLSDNERSLFDQMVARLQREEPLQYVLGECEFAGLRIGVAQGVLIPRPETEQLVRLIIREQRGKAGRILDIGCGSGCIAIALAAHLGQSKVEAWDISAKALEIAGRNAAANRVTVGFKQTDVMHDRVPHETWDLIVSNPPYVLNCEKAGMQNNVLAYEPHEALFVPDNDPLRFYRRIAEIACGHLSEHGCVYVEINERWGKETAALFASCGCFGEVTLINDFFGKERFVKACR